MDFNAALAKEPRVPDTELDVITIGRASVDLYGQQIGGRLEDMASFAKSVGGCPANIAIGAARLGLRTALITRVGDEAFGRFIREQLTREGVDVRGVATDPKRLTALAILGVRDPQHLPADLLPRGLRRRRARRERHRRSLHPQRRARSSSPARISPATNSAAAQRKAMRIATRRRPPGHLRHRLPPQSVGPCRPWRGEQRYIASDQVSAHLQAILPDCDLIVGTEEEVAHSRRHRRHARRARAASAS